MLCFGRVHFYVLWLGVYFVRIIIVLMLVVFGYVGLDDCGGCFLFVLVIFVFMDAVLYLWWMTVIV